MNKKFLLVICFVLLQSYSVYSEDADKDIFSNSFSSGFDKASGLLNNPNIYNSGYSSGETNNIKSNFDNWLKDSGNLGAITGNSDNTLKTVGSGEKVNINIDCQASQKTLAKLEISDGNRVNLEFTVLKNINNINLDFSMSNIVGVCSNRVTVCDINTNKSLCNKHYNYTNYGSDNKKLPSNISEGEKGIIESHPCYRVRQCMNWEFDIYKPFPNLELNIPTVLPSSGENCPVFMSSNGISIVEKGMIVEQVNSAVSKLAGINLSDIIVDNTNSIAEYKEFSMSACNNNNAGTGMQNLDELYKYYNTANASTSKTDIINNYGGSNNPYNDILNSQSVKDYDFSNIKDTVGGAFQEGGQSFDKLVNNFKRPENCYNPTCTVDIVKTEKSINTDGTYKTVNKVERVFRECKSSSFKVVNGVSQTIYECPVNKATSTITETALLQDNKEVCSCNNKHQLTTNIKNVVLATSVAEAINNAACGDDE